MTTRPAPDGMVLNQWGRFPLVMYVAGLLLVVILLELDEPTRIVRNAPRLLLIGPAVSGTGLVLSDLSLRRTALWAVLWFILVAALFVLRVVIGVWAFGEPLMQMD